MQSHMMSYATVTLYIQGPLSCKVLDSWVVFMYTQLFYYNSQQVFQYEPHAITLSFFLFEEMDLKFCVFVDQ